MTTRPARTPRERCGLVTLARHPNGKVMAAPDPIARFAEKCRFDPTTGCVLWTGGTTRGRGNSAVYGSFWYDGRRWFAHRFAAVHIHGLDLGHDTVGHCCPGGPRTLCVEHVARQSLGDNVAERNVRHANLARQTANERQYWLLVERGYEQAPEQAANDDPDDIPFHAPPEWLRPYLPVASADAAPF